MGTFRTQRILVVFGLPGVSCFDLPCFKKEQLSFVFSGASADVFLYRGVREGRATGALKKTACAAEVFPRMAPFIFFLLSAIKNQQYFFFLIFSKKNFF